MLVSPPLPRLCAVSACDGEDHEGVLVRQRSGQAHRPAHQEDPVSAQRGGGRQDVRPSPSPSRRGWVGGAILIMTRRPAGDAQPETTKPTPRHPK